MKLKICGVRSGAMFEACEQAGVDYIGINCVSGSRRSITRFINEQTPEWWNVPTKMKKVGVFQFIEDKDNPEMFVHYIQRCVEKFGLQVIQCHGEEDLDILKVIRQEIANPHNVTLWKAFSLGHNPPEEVFEAYSEVVNLFLFDGHTPGSGQKANAQVLGQCIECAKKAEISFGIAGGINVENIHLFRTNFPQARLLDVASGVEVGEHFSPKKLQALVKHFQD